MDSQETQQPLSRREREREAHRQEILNVAEGVFSAYGFEGTTIEMVARQAEFSVGSIYNFFKGKEDLFRQVFLSVARERTKHIHDAVTPFLDDPWKTLGAIAETWVAYYKRHGEFLRTAFSAITAGGTRNRPSGPPPPEFTEVFQAYYNEIVTAFTAVLKSPEVRPMPLRDAVIVAEGVVREYLKASSHDPATGAPTKPPKDVASKLTKLLCDLFRKGETA